MVSRSEALERIKHSLKIKEEMIKSADERLNKWQQELNNSGSISFS